MLDSLVRNFSRKNMFRNSFQNEDAKVDLDYLCREGSRRKIVLGCYCEEEPLCHRSIIAGILLGMGAEIDTSTEYRKYYEMFRRCI